MPYLHYIALLLGAGLVAALITIHAVRQRPAGGALALAALTSCITWWCLMYAAEIAGVFGEHLTWIRLMYAGIVGVPLCYLLFAVQYSRPFQPLSPAWWLLTIEPLSVATLVWFEPDIGFLWTDVVPAVGVATVKGVGFWIHTAYSYVLLIVASIILLRHLFRASGVYRHQVVAMWIACLAPWMANLIYLAGLSPFPGLDLTPFAFVVSGVGLTWGLMRHDLLRLGPLAHRLVVDSIDEGIIVLDRLQRVVDANPAAQRILSRNLGEMTGTSADQLLPGLRLEDEDSDVPHEIRIHTDSGSTLFEIKSDPVVGRQGRHAGRIVQLRDITRARRRDAERGMLQEIRDKLWQMEQSSELPAILGSIAEGLRDLPLEFDHCGLNVLEDLEEDGDQQRTPVFMSMSVNRAGQPMTATDDNDNDPGQAIVKAWMTRTTAYRPDLYVSDEYRERSILENAFGSVRSVLDVPFAGGSLALNSRLPNAFETADIAFLERLAAILSEAYMRQRDMLLRERHLLELRREIETRTQTEIALRQAKEEAESANRAKSDFLSNISHELRTPMNAILGMMDLVLESSLSASQRNYLSTSRQSADHLLDLLNELLDFARLEQGDIELDAAPFSVRECVTDAVQGLTPRANDKGLNLAVRVPSDVPGIVIGDAGRLRQILINIVGNAIKFTETGEVIISARVAPGNAQPDDGVKIEFSVQDTGPGIAEDRQQVIFEPFAQADVSTTRVHGGTGLGLAICDGLVQSMGGRIQVTSQLGQGSTFRFDATFGLPADDQQAVSPDGLRPGLRVLVVDAHEPSRMAALDILEAWSVAGTAVATPLEAVRACESQNFDVLLVGASATDAEVDGLDFLVEASGGADIIVMTTFDGLDAWAAAGDSIRGVIVKPIAPQQILPLLKFETLQPADPQDHLPSEPRRVLLVDDTAANQVYASSVLRRRGHEVVLAGDGLEALDILSRDDSFDVILMDIHMPRMGGLEASARIRQRQSPDQPGVPIIALTADVTHTDSERYHEAGMNGHLTKPFRPQALVDAVEQAVTGSAPVTPAPMDGAPEGHDRLTFGRAMAAVEHDPELLQELAAIVTRDVPVTMERVRAAMAQQDAAAVEQATHALNNLLGLLGSHRAMQTVRQLEDLAREGDLASATDPFERVELEVPAFLSDLNDIVQAGQRSVPQ